MGIDSLVVPANHRAVLFVLDAFIDLDFITPKEEKETRVSVLCALGLPETRKIQFSTLGEMGVTAFPRKLFVLSMLLTKNLLIEEDYKSLFLRKIWWC
jgi:hypothetical protein